MDIEASNNLLVEYKDVFEGLGCLQGDHHIDIDQSIPPVQHASHRTPVALKKKLKQKIDEMEKTASLQKLMNRQRGKAAW